MRVACLVALGLAGCSFNVTGTPAGDPAGGTGAPSPTQSVPDAHDAGATAPPTTTPPPSAPSADMTLQRVGTACTGDPQCDPGLMCAKSFGLGPGHVDIPGGYCTLDCSHTACPPGSFCATLDVGKFCLSACPPDPCRTGYKCCDQGKVKGACTTDALCNQGN